MYHTFYVDIGAYDFIAKYEPLQSISQVLGLCPRCPLRTYTSHEARGQGLNPWGTLEAWSPQESGNLKK